MARKLPDSTLLHFLVTVSGVSGNLLRFALSLLRSRAALSAENLFLRMQLAFYQERRVQPHRLSDAARICLVLWPRLFDWREALVVVKPATLIRWHCRAFRLLWRWKSRGGRPRLPQNIRLLIAEMVKENPTWGQAQVAEELALKLGISISPRTVRAYWPQAPLRSGPRAARSHHWRTFIRNHAKSVLTCDFFVAVLVHFQLLYVFVVMEIGTRRILHCNAPTLLVDAREQNSFDFSRFPAWFADIERKALKLGDYSIAGLEDVCVVERKDLSDLVHSFAAERAVFVHRLRLMAQYPHRLLVVTAPLSQVKSPYPHSAVNPNRCRTKFLRSTTGSRNTNVERSEEKRRNEF
jgi:hypothetical protein